MKKLNHQVFEPDGMGGGSGTAVAVIGLCIATAGFILSAIETCDKTNKGILNTLKKIGKNQGLYNKCSYKEKKEWSQNYQGVLWDLKEDDLLDDKCNTSSSLRCENDGLSVRAGIDKLIQCYTLGRVDYCNSCSLIIYGKGDK